MKSYPLSIAIWADQGLNTVGRPLLNWYYDTTLFGDTDEVISSVLGKLTAHNKARRFRQAVDWFFLTFFGQTNHCWESIEWDEGGK
jgi:hypothetical protein